MISILALKKSTMWVVVTGVQMIVERWQKMDELMKTVSWVNAETIGK